MQSGATECQRDGYRCRFICGIRLPRRAFGENVRWLYYCGTVSRDLFCSLSTCGAVLASLVFLVSTRCFHSSAGRKALYYRQQSRRRGEYRFLLSPVTTEGHHHQGFSSVVIVVLSAQHRPLAAFQEAREAFQRPTTTIADVEHQRIMKRI